MFDADIEKRPSACNPLPEPIQAHIARRNTFLPAYEESLNNNLRNFGEPESQVNRKAFDLVEEPKRGSRECMKREYLIIGTILLSLCAIALPLGLVYILRDTNSEQETTIMQTRRAESSFSLASVTASILPTAIVPMTVYVTVTPTPQLSIPILTITVTSPDVQVVTTKSQATNNLTSLSISTVTSSASISSSITSLQSSSRSLEVLTTPITSSISMIEPTLEASIQTQLSQASTLEHLTDTTTVVSATTIEPTRTSSKVLQTAKGRFGFCGVSGSNCARQVSEEANVDSVEGLAVVGDELDG